MVVVMMGDMGVLVLHGRPMVLLLLLLLLVMLLALLVVLMMVGFDVRHSMMERVGDKRMRGCESGRRRVHVHVASSRDEYRAGPGC